MSQPTDLFDAAGQRFNVDPNLLRAVFQTESGGTFGTPDSSAGAMGGMQLMPQTYSTMAQRYGLGSDPRDPYNNVMAGAATLSENLDRYGDVSSALKAYNGGTDPSRWNNPETAAYVGKVAQAYMPLASPSQAPGASAPQTPAPAASPAPYQVASNDDGTRSDVMPSPDAPPARSSTGAMSDDDIRGLLIGKSASAPSASGASITPSAPGATSPGAPASMSDDDIRGMLVGKPAASGSGSGSGFWSGLASGVTSAGEGIANVANHAAAYVDKAVPVLGSLDQAALPSIGLNQPAQTSATLTSDLASRDKANAGNVGYQVGKIGGDIALTLPAAELGAGVLGAGLGLGADAIGASTIAGQALRAGSNLATGTGATGLGKAATFLTSNAGKGVVMNELTGSPDTPGANAVSGAEYGVLGAAGLATAAPIAKGLTLLLGGAGRSILDSLAPAANDAALSATQGASRDAASAAPPVSAPSPAPASTGATPTMAPMGMLSRSVPVAPANRLAGAGLVDDGGAVGGTTPPSAPANMLAPGALPASSNALGGSAVASDATATAGGTSGAIPSASGYVPLSDIASTQAVPTSIKPQGLVLTQQQASDAADRVIQHFAAGGPTSLPTTVLPGSAFDASEATGNTGLAALKSFVINNNPSAGNLFAGIKDTNNAARMQVLSSIMGTPDDIASAEAARDALTSQAREAAFQNAQPVNVTPIASAMQDAIDAKNGYPSVQKPLQDIKDTLDSVTQTDPQTGAVTTDPRALWNVRQEINAMISPMAAGTAKDGRQAAAQLIALKPVLDTEIEKGAPGFGNFIDQYSKLSAPIDGMNWLQKQGITITDPQGNITLNKIDGTIKALQKQQGAPGAREADGVTPDQYQALLASRENLRQAGAAVYRGRLPGSDTARNLGSNAFVNALTAGTHGYLGHTINSLVPAVGEATAGPMGLFLGGAMSAARYGAGATVNRGSNMIMDQLANKLTDPNAYQKAVNPLVGR